MIQLPVKLWLAVFLGNQLLHFIICKWRVTSMMVTVVGEEMCWRQLGDVGDGFGRSRHQHPLSFYISVEHQHSKDVTNAQKLSLTSTYHWLHVKMSGKYFNIPEVGKNVGKCHHHLCSFNGVLSNRLSHDLWLTHAWHLYFYR